MTTVVSSFKRNPNRHTPQTALRSQTSPPSNETSSNSHPLNTPPPLSSLPPGTRFSAHNGQPLISTGVPSLDDLLGGGLPLGSVLLLLEDRQTAYAKLLLGYYLAQGLSAGHALLVASADETPESILSGVPWLADSKEDVSSSSDSKEKSLNVDEDKDEEQETETGSAEDKMTIAWRYQGLRKIESDDQPRNAATNGGHYCDVFDLTRKIDAATIAASQPRYVDATDWAECNEENSYARLLSEVSKVIEEGRYRTIGDSGSSQKVLRIGLQSLASPLWPSRSSRDLFKFLHGLRGRLRSTSATCVVTVPAHLYADDPAGEALIRQSLHCVDAALAFESFAGHPEIAHPSYAASYHGLVQALKLPHMNALLPAGAKLAGSGAFGGGGARDNLAFRLRRRRFAIETFHLPPEGGIGVRSEGPPKGTSTTRKPVGVLRKSESGSTMGSSASVSISVGGSNVSLVDSKVKTTSPRTRKKVMFAGGGGCGGGEDGGNHDLDF